MKLIRWDEMPDFLIYNDQLCNIVTAQLEDFLSEPYLPVTTSMVNNYVKHKIIKKPIKKKYDREHLASVIVITLLKQVFSIDEIKTGTDLMLKLYPPGRSYDMFCQIIENEWGRIEKEPENIENVNPYLLKAGISIANNIYVKNYLHKKAGENYGKEQKQKD